MLSYFSVVIFAGPSTKSATGDTDSFYHNLSDVSITTLLHLFMTVIFRKSDQKGLLKFIFHNCSIILQSQGP